MRYDILSKKSIRLAESHLSQADNVMAGLISCHGPCTLFRREYSPFYALADSIISQQISAKAAAKIKLRISEITPIPFTPGGVLNISPDLLINAGLSSAKARYIIELAARAVDGRLDFSALHYQDEETVISTLTDLPGIGLWTAEMFMILALRRANVMAFGDAGLQRAAKLLYGKRGLSKSLAKLWSPYCSVASWYLWRHIEKPYIQ